MLRMRGLHACRGCNTMTGPAAGLTGPGLPTTSSPPTGPDTETGRNPGKTHLHALTARPEGEPAGPCAVSKGLMTASTPSAQRRCTPERLTLAAATIAVIAVTIYGFAGLDTRFRA